MVSTAIPPARVGLFGAEAEPVDDVLVAVPALNEERFIGSVVHAVLLEGFHCLVIDDGSSDRTATIAAAAGAMVERHEQNLGKAEALNSAFQFARKRGVSVLVAMDGDAQHDPRQIKELVRPIQAGEADIVSGSRFIGSGRDGIPRVRRLGMQAFTVTSNMVSGALVTDTLSGFRAFSRPAIEGLRFKSDRFSVEFEIQFLARNGGLRQIEVPITASYADPPKRNVVGYGLHLLDGLIRLVGRYRPLLFFGIPGIVFLLAGIWIGGIVIDTYQRSQTLAGGLALLAVLLVILGSIGAFAAVLLHVLRGMFLELEADIQALPEASASVPHQR
jgi:glycosyltransferase involved in cell wall biosynthesis